MTPPAEPESTGKLAKPGILDRLRARYGWFDHVVRAQERYEEEYALFVRDLRLIGERMKTFQDRVRL